MRVENEQVVEYTNAKWISDINHNSYKVETGKSFKTNIFGYLAYGVSLYEKVYEEQGGGKLYNRINEKSEFVKKEDLEGKMKQKNDLLQRKGVASGSIFDLVIRFDQQYKDQIVEILSLFSCFGALGAKSRNGFGKIVIDKIDEQPFHTDIVELCKKYFGKMEECPKYTAFSKKSSLFGSNYRYEKWQDALAEIGDAYRMARIGENFKDGLLGDHRSGKNRQYLSLPLKISYNEDVIDPRDGKTKKKKVEFNIEELGLERMAKQFFMIVEPEKDEEGELLGGYILHLPFKIKDVAHRADKKKWREANVEMKRRLEGWKDKENEEIFTVEIRGEVIKDD